MRAPFLRTLQHLRRASSRAQQPPQRFLLLCRCGQALQGNRQPRFLTITCPACGDRRFIAARSPWPRPASLHASYPDPAAQTVVAGTPAERIELRPWQLPSPSASLDRVHATLAAVFRRLIPPRRWFTVPRLATATVVLFLVATLAWSSHRRHLARYRAELETSLTAGRSALADSDFSTALAQLEVADRAAYGLGYSTPNAREAAQLFREVRIWTRLSTEPLAPFLAYLPADPTSEQQADAARRFDRQYVGRTLIFDGFVHRETVWLDPSPPVPAPGDDPLQGRAGQPHRAPQPGMLQLVGDRPVPRKSSPRQQSRLRFDGSLVAGDSRLELDLPDVPCFAHVTASAPARVIFGAEVAALAYASSPPATWQLSLVPASCTLLTLPGPLIQQGWPDDEQLQATLQAQATLATRVTP